MMRSGTDRFFHRDWQGSTRYLTDDTGAAATAEVRYGAYGNQAFSSGDSLTTPYRYAGARGYDSGDLADLQHLYQRWYAPDVGRFLSRDPIGWAGGLNLYGYCGNDPVNFVDPLGLSPDGDYWLTRGINFFRPALELEQRYLGWMPTQSASAMVFGRTSRGRVGARPKG